ncbi:MAG: hypothetical protein ABIA11_01275 [Patescibacteria group bacterium]
MNKIKSQSEREELIRDIVIGVIAVVVTIAYIVLADGHCVDCASSDIPFRIHWN